MIPKQMLATLEAMAADYGRRGQVQTAIPRLSIWCSFEPTEPTPAMFEPKFYMLLQGTKRLTVGDGSHHFGAGSCAVSCVGVPFTSQVIEASPVRPYIGLELRLDAGVVASLLLRTPEVVGGNAPAFAVVDDAADLLEPLNRLIGLLIEPADIPFLAEQYERELCYRLLQGPLGSTLRTIVQKNTRFDQIRKAAEWIRDHAREPMHVPNLAESVGMSVSSFHRHFKAVTAHSPLAYQRHIRLLEAQRLLASGATTVTSAAFATGYASSSQFSREYKRMFGVPPKRDKQVPPGRPHSGGTASFPRLEPATTVAQMRDLHVRSR